MEHTRIVRAPHLSDDATASASAFQRFWERYPRRVGKEAAARAWLSVVTIDTEPLVESCLNRYLSSGEVARGVIQGADRWLFTQHRDGWAGEWPEPKPVASVRGLGAMLEGLSES